MRRVQNHFGIPSSSIAQSDIDERKHERIVDWVVETKTVVEEEEEEEEEPLLDNLLSRLFYQYLYPNLSQHLYK
jgi:hypothetical protein